MNIELTQRSAPGDLGRVKWIGEEGRFLYIELGTGRFASVRAAEPFELSIGDSVFVNEDEVHRAPKELLPDERWVAVVKSRLDDLTVLDASGHLRAVPTNDIDYEVGNTVLATAEGVDRKLDDQPLRIWDSGSLDEAALTTFKQSPGSGSLSFDDFGGLKKVVQRARELVEGTLQNHDKLKAIKARSIKGVLFTGNPGTGKTMLARIVAKETNATLYLIRGPEFVSKWVGESEQVLRIIFDDAAKQDRAIIFFDEIDSVAGRRSENDHDASRRVVTQLLTLMDRAEPSENVIVIATTNRPDDIDEALLRAGRFDWRIEFPPPTRDDRVEMLNIAANRYTNMGYLPHSEMAQQTEGWTAADLDLIWTEAALLAVADGREVIMAEDYAGGFRRVQEQKRLASAAGRQRGVVL
jgi:transitional endoplasmic reticulum ATPase